METDVKKAWVDDDYSYKGYRLVIIENEAVKIVVLPEKGADIYCFIDKKNNFDFLWKTPLGLRRHVRDVPAGYGNESNFSNSYEGGWQMVFPNGGSSCFYKGVHLEMCGDACMNVWKYRIADAGPDRVRVVFETRTHRLPYTLKRIMELSGKEAVLRVTEIIKNDGEEDLNYTWGQHVAFDGDLLRDGNWRLRVPCKHVYTNTGSLVREAKPPAGNRRNRFPRDGEFLWPLVKDRDGRDVDLSFLPEPGIKSCDIAYLHELSEGSFALVNGPRQTAFQLSWNKNRFPYLWYYQNFGGSFEYPWYGRGNGIALEPITSFPALGLVEAITRDNAGIIKAGEEIACDFEAKILPTKAEIENFSE